MSSNDPQKAASFAQLIYGGLTCFVCLILITLGYSYNQSLQERKERASLYTQMIESNFSRTLEAMEITLSSFSNKLSDPQLTPQKLTTLRNQVMESLKFAPHLRQIVILKNGKTIVDTRNDPSIDINYNILGFDDSQSNLYSLGLMIGTQIRSRFFPYKGYFPDESEHRELIPIALDVINQINEPVRIIAAFNPSYIKRTLRALPLHGSDYVYITDLESNSLVQSGLYGPYKYQITQLIQKALSEDIDAIQQSEVDQYFPSNTTTIRLSEKYPFAVSLVTNHLGSVEQWAKEHQNLLVIIMLATCAMLFGAVFVIRSHHQALKMKEDVHLLSEVVEHTPTIVVITNNDGDIEYVNESFERETGYTKSEVIGQSPRLLKSGGTSDQEYLDMWGALSSGKTWIGEFQNRRKDGSLYWERASIGPLKDTHENITHYIALKQPIDEEKKAQEKLRLASTVFESATEAIMVTNIDNQIEMINPAFQTITGYAENDVLGKTPSILKSGKHATDFYEELYSSLKTRGSWEGEIWNRRRNSEIYPQWLMISSRCDQNGALEGYVALFSDITQRKKAEALMVQQANYDSITALPNRNLFFDRLKQALTLSDRNQSKTALLFIDLDYFKKVNDTYGHHVGDLLLKQVAERLRAEVRKSDTVARLGGDEFAIIIPSIQKLEIIEKIVKNILTSLSKSYRLNEENIHISCSVGIAFYPDDSTQPENLIINADQAMYKAKQQGRNTHQYFNELPN